MWVKYHGVNIDLCNSALEIIIVSGISEKASTPRQCSKSTKIKYLNIETEQISCLLLFFPPTGPADV